MDRIEWNSEQRYQPPERGLREFWHSKGAPSPALAPEPARMSRPGGDQPQIGRPPLETPVVFVSNQALEALHQFLAHDQSREHGGVLVGLPYRDVHTGQYFVDIQRAIPAFETEGSGTHLQFTPAAWEYISGLLEEDASGLMIVGWYHSHPGLGVFFSGTDLASHRAFFDQPWSAAVVVDPVIHKTGWFCGPQAQRLPREQVYVYSEEHTPQSPARDLTWLLPLALFAAACLTGWLLLAPRWRG